LTEEQLELFKGYEELLIEVRIACFIYLPVGLRLIEVDQFIFITTFSQS